MATDNPIDQVMEVAETSSPFGMLEEHNNLIDNILSYLNVADLFCVARCCCMMRYAALDPKKIIFAAVLGNERKRPCIEGVEPPSLLDIVRNIRYYVHRACIYEPLPRRLFQLLITTHCERGRDCCAFDEATNKPAPIHDHNFLGLLVCGYCAAEICCYVTEEMKEKLNPHRLVAMAVYNGHPFRDDKPILVVKEWQYTEDHFPIGPYLEYRELVQVMFKVEKCNTLQQEEQVIIASINSKNDYEQTCLALIPPPTSYRGEMVSFIDRAVHEQNMRNGVHPQSNFYYGLDTLYLTTTHQGPINTTTST